MDGSGAGRTGPGPLADIKVVDLTRMVVGPVATMLLADLGADVVKVEPSGGDAARHLQEVPEPERSPFFIAVNRNKRSLVLDLDRAEARAVLRHLVGSADVVVHNFLEGIVERFDLGYERMREWNPHVVYCSVSAFGPGAPMHGRPGTDVLFQAMGGLMSVTGEPHGRPMRAGAPIFDVGAGVTAAFAILAGLAHRSRTGEGCAVETSLYDNAVFAQTPLLAWSELAGAAPPRLGNRSPLALIVEADCSDGPLMIALPTDKLWRRLCAAIEREDLSDDPRFGGVSDRLRHQLDIANELRAGFAARTKAEWEEDLVAAGVPCAPVRDYVEVLADRQLAENDMLLTMEHPMTGAFRVVGNPVRSTGWTVGVERRSPLLGEHSDEVLREYGVPDDLVAALRAGGS